MKILSMLFFLCTAIVAVESHAGGAGIDPFPKDNERGGGAEVQSASNEEEQVVIKAFKEDKIVKKELSEILTNKSCKLSETSPVLVSGTGMMGGSKSAYIVVQRVDCEPMITTSVVALVKTSQVRGTRVTQPVETTVSIIRLEQN